MSSIRDRIAERPLLRAIFGFIIMFIVLRLTALVTGGSLASSIVVALVMSVYFYFRGSRKKLPE